MVRRTPEIASGDHGGVVIVGGSRILFDTNLDVWEEMTGRRPVQLALPGMSGQAFLRDIAVNSTFDGLVLIDVTPAQFFREGPGNPEFEGVLGYWEDEGPAKRVSHRIGLLLSRYLAFLDNQYSLTELIDQLDVPNRGQIGGPYLGHGSYPRTTRGGSTTSGAKSRRTSGCASTRSAFGRDARGRRPRTPWLHASARTCAIPSP